MENFVSFSLVADNDLSMKLLCRWSKGEQSTALATATGSSSQVCLLLPLKTLQVTLVAVCCAKKYMGTD